MHSSKFDPTPRPCSSRESIISTYRFLGVCMVKVEKPRQQLPIHGLRRGLILQPRRSWIQCSRQNGLQRRNGDDTISARFPVKERMLDINKTEKTKSNADNFKPRLFVDLFLRHFEGIAHHMFEHYVIYRHKGSKEGVALNQRKKRAGYTYSGNPSLHQQCSLTTVDRLGISQCCQNQNLVWTGCRLK